MEKLVLIDGNSLINRAFYATPLFNTKSGVPTNGVFGFIKLLLKIFSDKNPSYCVVAFDLHAPTFRHKLYNDYKAGRKPMPEDLAVQMPILKDVLHAMGIRICELQGYEADDVIGTLAKKFALPTYIYTGDRDSYQLVDESTSVCFTRKGVSDILELSHSNFKDETGLTPSQIIDLKALMGDKSDHIPGVAGVGEKSAMGLLQKYGDLDGVYANVEELSGTLYNKLLNGKETAYFSKQLATIDCNAPISLTLEECFIKMPFPSALKEKFAELEFKSLLAMDIFESEKAEDGTQARASQPKVEEICLESIEDGLNILQNAKEKCVACHLEDSDFRFAFVAEDEPLPSSMVEYVLPMKEGLLDVGFFDYQCIPIFQAIFEGERRIICYNAKETMHRLKEIGIAFSAPFDDVSILKYIAEGLGNSDSLALALTKAALPEKNTAFGLACLKAEYIQSLKPAEKTLYETVELPLVQVLFDMEVQGVCVNAQALEKLSARYNEELRGLTERIYAEAGETFNINSTQQLGKILFEKLKIGNGAKKSKGGQNYKTTAEELEKYADEWEIVRLLLRYRKVQKLNSTYIEGFKPLIVKGKVHTTYHQSNTATGRLSSANPNLQNIPIRTDEGRELRKLFTASEGNVLIDADYSQIELRLLAHFSGCKELIAAYCDGKDIHAITASQVFEVPLEKVTPQLRRAAKAVNFGIIYGISAFGLSNDLNIGPKKAKEYIDKYFEAYSDVKEYMAKNVETATKDGYITTLLGRRRMIYELKSSNYNLRSFGERAAMNMPLQGSSADIIKIAMLHVHQKLKEGAYRARLVLQVHDELVIDCPKDEMEAVSRLLKEEMENAVSLNVPLIADIGVGNCWFDTK